jgi:hypothetical protein
MRDTGETGAASPIRRPVLHRVSHQRNAQKGRRAPFPRGGLSGLSVFHVPVTTTPGDGRGLTPCSQQYQDRVIICNALRLPVSRLSCTSPQASRTGTVPHRGRSREARQSLSFRRAGSNPRSRDLSRRLQESEGRPGCTTCRGTASDPSTDKGRSRSEQLVARGCVPRDRGNVVRRFASKTSTLDRCTTCTTSSQDFSCAHMRMHVIPECLGRCKGSGLKVSDRLRPPVSLPLLHIYLLFF